MRDDTLESLNGLLLLARVKHVRVELEVSVRLVLASFENITFTLLTAIGGSRLNDTMATRCLGESFHVTLLGGGTLAAGTFALIIL